MPKGHWTSFWKCLRQRIVLLGGREAIRTRLLALAPVRKQAALSLCGRTGVGGRPTFARKRRNCRRCGGTWARASEEGRVQSHRVRVSDQEWGNWRRLENVCGKTGGARCETVEATTPEQEVAAALRLFDEMERITRDAGARGEIQQLLKTLNLNVWLRFGARPTSGGRVVRVVGKRHLDHRGWAKPQARCTRKRMAHSRQAAVVVA